jgi:Ca-activated chloride channel homolog
MNRIILSVIFLSVFFSSVYAQSGRKVAVVPKPAAVPASVPDDREQFSDSKPNDGFSYSKKKATAPAPVQPKADVTQSADDDTIRVDTNLVSVPVSVYERSGVYVGGLRQNDFKIFENGKEQEVAYFGTTEVPFTVVLLVDVSGSTDQKIRDIQAAAMSFIENLKPNDRVSVVEFAETMDTLCDFTNDRAVLEKAIRRLRSGGGTALYDAVDSVLKRKFKNIQGRKAVVLFTDGVDTSFNTGGYERTLALAEEGDAVVYSVYYNTYLAMRGINTGGGPMTGIPTISRAPNVPGMRAEDYAKGRAYLEEMARLTGGKMFRADSTTGGLGAAFEGIANELGNQYTLGYYPNEPGKNGERRQIKVRVNRPQVAVRARDWYIVGASAPAGK